MAVTCFAQEAATIITDTFDGEAGSTAGQLNRMRVGSSDKLLWEATPNVKLTRSNDRGCITTTSASTALVARIKLPPAERRITVEAELQPESTEGKLAWMGIGFGKSSLGNPTFGGLCVILRTNTTYSLLFNPDPEDITAAKVINLKSGPIPSYRSHEMIRVKLTYDVEFGAISVWINGQKEVSGMDLKAKKITPSLTYAGISGYNQEVGVPCASNFGVAID